MSRILSKFMDIIKGIIGEKKYLLFLFFFFFVTWLPGILTDNPSFYWQQKQHGLGPLKGSNPLFSVYRHIAQDQLIQNQISDNINELRNQKT